MSAEATPAAPASAPTRGATERPSCAARIVRFACVALLVLADLSSKSAVFAWLDPSPASMVFHNCGQPRQVLVGDWLAFMLNLNPGMAFGIVVPAPVLVAGRALAVVFLALLLWRCGSGQRLMSGALILILAGALGNLYDNVALAPDLGAGRFGKVRDFIDVYVSAFDWHYPTFNVADSCISVGAVFLLLASLRSAKGSERAARAPHGTPGVAPPGRLH